MNADERRFLVAIQGLTNSNPFLPSWVDWQRMALGSEFVEGSIWSILNNQGLNRNLESIKRRAEQLVKQLWPKLQKGPPVSKQDWPLYDLFARWIIYYRYSESLHQLITTSDRNKPQPRITVYRQFERDVRELFQVPGAPPLTDPHIAHLFACLFQIRRAFYYIFTSIVGHSMPIARLRAAVWQSIFTRDIQLHFRLLHNRMADFCTLITGPTGTGKELVARSIALSCYIPFEPSRMMFSHDHWAMYLPVNLAALAPTLIESELFGHRRGAFTGALEDRSGWLEARQPSSTIFLDEIGEIDQGLQVKLLRVLQTRTFHRLGDMESREFKGKVIAATNRNLTREMENGKFRPDFYYRLCSDIIVTPSLREQVAQNPEELSRLVDFLVRRIAGDDPALTGQIVSWIEKNLGIDYAWPGNMRELEQCVRNILVRGEYIPQTATAGTMPRQFLEDLSAGTLTADQVLRGYAEQVYSKVGNYAETARQLRLDRRTVKRLLSNKEEPS